MKTPPQRRLPSKYTNISKADAPDNFNADKIQAELDKIAEQNAEEFLQLLITNIRSNKYGFVLDPSTVKRKGSDTPLINQEYLINSLERQGTIVTIKEGTHPSGIKMLELAMMLEYGRKDKHIPAFPVARNTFEDFAPEAEANLLNYLKDLKR